MSSEEYLSQEGAPLLEEGLNKPFEENKVKPGSCITKSIELLYILVGNLYLLIGSLQSTFPPGIFLVGPHWPASVVVYLLIIIPNISIFTSYRL